MELQLEGVEVSVFSSYPSRAVSGVSQGACSSSGRTKALILDMDPVFMTKLSSKPAEVEGGDEFDVCECDLSSSIRIIK